MDEWIEIAKALSDANRIRALLALGDGELCACRIIDLLGIAPSTVSAHMAVLQRAGLVEVRKDGRWRHYRLAKQAASPLARKFLRMAERELAEQAFALDDRAALREATSKTAACPARGWR